MRSTLMKRLEKLEQTRPALIRKWHSLIGDTEAELDAKTQALRASPAWQEGDGIIRTLIVDPPRREHAASAWDDRGAGRPDLCERTATAS